MANFLPPEIEDWLAEHGDCQAHPPLLGAGASLGEGRELYQRQQKALMEATAAAQRREGHVTWHATRAAVDAYLRHMREAGAS